MPSPSFQNQDSSPNSLAWYSGSIRCEAFQQERAEEGQDNSEKFLELMKEEDPQIQEVLQVLRMGNKSNYTLFIRW